MEKYDYKINDNFKARRIYQVAVFYSKMINHKNTKFISYSADKINHFWEECTIKINTNRIKLHFAGKILKIKFFGNDETKQSSKKNLEKLTGIKID